MWEDEEGFRKSQLSPKLEWLEVAHVKGVKVERGYNPHHEMAVCNQADAWRGLVRFTFHEAHNSEHTAFRNYKQLQNNMILRAYVQVVSKTRLRFTHSTDGVRLGSFQKFLVVENDLYRPPAGAMYELEEEELLAHYSLNRWYLADVNGMFKGNNLLPREDQVKKTLVY